MGRELRLQARTFPRLSLFVDTSVWSLAFRRDRPERGPEVGRLMIALQAGELVVTAGLVLQELLQGFGGPRDRQAILARFASIPFLTPAKEDHVAAAELRNACRRGGVQLGTIDALLVQLCLRHELILLSADQDFAHAAPYCDLALWKPA